MKKWIALILALAMCLSLAVCSSAGSSTGTTSDETASTGEETAADESSDGTVDETDQENTDTLTSDVLPEDVIGNTYLYDEVNEAYGFTTSWELSFTGEGEGSMFEPNDFMGDTTYTVSWSYADGLYTVTLMESDSGNMSISAMFERLCRDE